MNDLVSQIFNSSPKIKTDKNKLKKIIHQSFLPAIDGLVFTFWKVSQAVLKRDARVTPGDIWPTRFDGSMSSHAWGTHVMLGTGLEPLCI